MLAIKLLPKWLLRLLKPALYAQILKYTSRTSEDVVSQFIKDPRLRALLSGGQLIDWNLRPSKVCCSSFRPLVPLHFGCFSPTCALVGILSRRRQNFARSCVVFTLRFSPGCLYPGLLQRNVLIGVRGCCSAVRALPFAHR